MHRFDSKVAPGNPFPSTVPLRIKLKLRLAFVFKYYIRVISYDRVLRLFGRLQSLRLIITSIGVSCFPSVWGPEGGRTSGEREGEGEKESVFGWDYQGNGEDLFFFTLPLFIIFLEMSMLLFVIFP